MQNVLDRKSLIQSKKGYENSRIPTSKPAKSFSGLFSTNLLLDACKNLSPIEKYDRFSMTMSDRPWMEKNRQNYVLERCPYFNE
jgi:hypothetical protein